MKQLHSINYYMHLLADECECCAAYNEIGGCGTWRFTCQVAEERQEAEDFMDWAHLSFEQFINLIEYWECVESLDYWNNVIAPRLEEEQNYDSYLESSKDAMFYDEQPFK